MDSEVSVHPGREGMAEQLTSYWSGSKRGDTTGRGQGKI
jgi:hypothetical protein